MITADDFEDSIRIQEHNRLIQRRIDLPSPLPSEIKIDTVGDGNGCVILQVLLQLYYSFILVKIPLIKLIYVVNSTLQRAQTTTQSGLSTHCYNFKAESRKMQRSANS